MSKEIISIKIAVSDRNDLRLLAALQGKTQQEVLTDLIAEAKRDLQERGKWPKG